MQQNNSQERGLVSVALHAWVAAHHKERQHASRLVSTTGCFSAESRMCTRAWDTSPAQHRKCQATRFPAAYRKCCHRAGLEASTTKPIMPATLSLSQGHLQHNCQCSVTVRAWHKAAAEDNWCRMPGSCSSDERLLLLCKYETNLLQKIAGVTCLALAAVMKDCCCCAGMERLAAKYGGGQHACCALLGTGIAHPTCKTHLLISFWSS